LVDGRLVYESFSRYPEHMFVACELIQWLRTNVGDLKEAEAAMNFANLMLRDRRIRRLRWVTHSDYAEPLFSTSFSGKVQNIFHL
jgi:hypothetical protein